MKPNFPSFDAYIRMFPSAWLFDHFLEPGRDTRKILSSNALADRVAAFSEPAGLQRRFMELTEAEKRLCALAYLFGESGLPVPEKSDYLSDPAILSFLVYAARDSAGAVRYFGFAEFEPSLRPLMAQTLLDAEPPREVVEATASSRPEHCLIDITAVMVLALQGVLDKKKQGGLTKNSLLKIGRLTHDTFPGFSVQDRADCMTRYAQSSGMIVENETGFRCRGGVVEEWLSRSPESRIGELSRFIVGYAGGWSMELLAAICRAGERWLPLALFPEQARQEALKTLLTLQWAGIVDCAGAGDEIFFGAQRCGEAALPHPGESESGRPAAQTGAPAIVVMPDFAAVLPQEISSEELFHFGRVGILHSLDRVYKGAIDRSTLNDSLARGLDGGTILAWLAGWNTPANVVETLREWIREYYRLYIADDPMLITCDEKVTYEIASYEPLAGLVERVPAVAVFRIKPGAGESVRKVLTGMGYDFRMPTPEPPAQGLPEAPSPSARAIDPIVSATGRPSDTMVLKGKKYGSGLKALDLNETMHIVDYAILTTQEVTIDYSGSPLMKKGLYTFLPVAVSGGAEPLLDGSESGGKKRQFFIRKIVRIGVGRP